MSSGYRDVSARDIRDIHARCPIYILRQDVVEGCRDAEVWIITRRYFSYQSPPGTYRTRQKGWRWGADLTFPNREHWLQHMVANVKECWVKRRGFDIQEWADGFILQIESL